VSSSTWASGCTNTWKPACRWEASPAFRLSLITQCHHDSRKTAARLLSPRQHRQHSWPPWWKRSGRQLPPHPADPLRTARLLAEAADLGITLSTAELAEAIGVSHGTVNKWSDGHSPRPGIVLRRHQEAAGNLIWWAVERTAGSAHLVPARQLSDSTGMGRPVGFAAVIEAHVVDVTGSDLFDRMRIG